MKTQLGCTLAVLLAGSLLADRQSCADEYFQVAVPPSDKPGELQIGVTHTLWIPPGAEQIRGIIVHQHGCGTGACRQGKTAAYDLHWQELARKWDCALLGPSYQQAEEQNCRLWCDPRSGSGDVFVASLAKLAEQSGHPEIAAAPWCLWGHSGGGFWSSLMQMKYPERIVAIWFQSGTAFNRWESGEIEKPEIPAAAMKIPMIANPGLKERDDKRFHVAWSGNREMFQAYRAKGAPIAFTPDPQTGHDTGDSRYLAIPFFDAALSLRLPKKVGDPLRDVDLSQGWLCALDGADPAPAAEYQGNPLEANWLPGEAFARAWSQFVQTGAVGDDSPPPQPQLVAAAPQDAGGVRLQWTCRADFESGIQAFLVQRDGKTIARVPAQSPQRPYRSLFQGKSYGDTPEEPVAKMEFIDAAGKSGAKYRIIAVNSVGLASAEE